MQTNNCGSTIKPGAHCTAEVTWKPAMGQYPGVTINYDGAFLNPITPLGTEIASDSPLLLSKSNYISFGTQTIGNPSMERTVTATNVSGGDIEAPIVSVNGSKQFRLTGSTCSGTLKPQQSCVAAAIFRPTKAGDFTASFDFKGTGGGSIQLSGTAQLPVAITASALELQWGALLPGSSQARALELTNGSDEAIPITQVSFQLKDYSETDNCHDAVRKLSSCTVYVTFSPHKLGQRIDLMQIAFGGAIAPLQISLSGEGESAASFSPSSLDFGLNNQVGVLSGTQHVTLTNNLSTELNYKLSSTGPFEVTDACPEPLKAKASCTLSVAFKPGSSGELSGHLTVNVTGAAVPTSIPLTGTAYTPPFLKVSPASLTFGVNAGTTSYPLQISLTNTGSRQADIGALKFGGADAADFAVSGAPCNVVPGNSSCSFDVVFTPPAAGSFNATMTITSDATNGPHTVALSGTAY